MFASEQATYFKEFCSNTTDDDTTEYTIISQLGAHDLMDYPIRRFTDDPSTAQKLLHVLEAILSGSLHCKKLTHLVWVTAVPYPVCFNDGEYSCHNHRGFRNNPQIATSAEFILDSLLNLNSTLQLKIRVSIVDAFSIVKPRLMLDEDNEIICMSHYVCRVNMPDGTQEMVYTPAGSAVLQSILLAISASA